MVDLRNGRVTINPQFIMDKIHSLEDLLFIVLHERDHRLLRRIYRINWGRLNRILDFNEDWIAKVRNAMEDAWINASVRSEMGIMATLPEQFYCWTLEDEANPGMPSEDNPDGSGFNPDEHSVGEPKSAEYATLTCLSPYVDQDLVKDHEGLYIDADKLISKFGVTRTILKRARNRWDEYGDMHSFPAWYDLFCNWLEQHKDDLGDPAPDSEHDEDCPQHPQNQGGSGEGDEEGDGDSPGQGSGDGDSDEEGDGEGNGGDTQDDKGTGDKPTKGKHGHGGSKPCTCNGGEGLFSKPMSLAERISRIPDIVISADKLDEILDNLDGEDDNRKNPNGADEDVEVFAGSDRKGSSWGGHCSRTEVIPQEIQNLDEHDRELLEMGGSALTDSWKTETVQIKGAVKKYADELVQNIATMRVTEHKIIRPDFNMPMRPSRRDVMRMGMGDMPVMWDTPQYLEQNELVVYTDVSSSMNEWYSVALYLSNQLKEFGCEMYQFSTIVTKPIPGRDDNVFLGTGGTHFPVVAEHIVDNGFQAVVVITDNQDSLSVEWIEKMKEIEELYVVFLQDEMRPWNYDPETYAWGGSWGRSGWHLCTDKITGIFKSDVEVS
jgi:hypothetical protein